MRRAACVFVAFVLAGCAARTVAPPSENGRPRLDRISAERVAEDLARGQRSGSEVKARLGDATVVRFASGYEVWVYRIGPGANRTESGRKDGGELVILVAPSGDVVKVRTRFAGATD